MHCSIWGASFFAFLEETRVSLGAFVFRRQALSFFKTAIFRFPDYTRHQRLCATSMHSETKESLCTTDGYRGSDLSIT